jgi:hypothetical protein
VIPIGHKVRCVEGNGRLREGVEYEVIGHRSAAPFRFEAYVVRDIHGNVYHGLTARFAPAQQAGVGHPVADVARDSSPE